MAKQINDRRIEFSTDVRASEKLNRTVQPGSASPDLHQLPTISQEEVAAIQGQQNNELQTSQPAAPTRAEQVAQTITELTQQTPAVQNDVMVTQTTPSAQAAIQSRASQVSVNQGTQQKAEEAPSNQTRQIAPTNQTPPTSSQTKRQKAKQEKASTNELNSVNNAYTPSGPMGTRYHTGETMTEEVAKESELHQPVEQSETTESSTEKESVSQGEAETPKKSEQETKGKKKRTLWSPSENARTMFGSRPSYKKLINSISNRNRGIEIVPELVEHYQGDVDKIAEEVIPGMFQVLEDDFNKPTGTNYGVPEDSNLLDRQIVNNKTEANIFAKKQAEIRAQIIRLFRNPYMLRVEGTETKMQRLANGFFALKQSYPKEFRDYLKKKSKETGLNEGMLIQSMILHGGIGLDNSNASFDYGGWWGGSKESENFGMNQDELMTVLDDTLESIKRFGHPCGYTGSEIELHGTKCYPIGYLSEQFANDLIEQLKNGTSDEYKNVTFSTAKEMREAIKDQWDNVTLPILQRETMIDHKDQYFAIANMLRAFIEEGGDDYTKWGMSYFVDAHISEIYREMEEIYVKEIDPAVADAIQARTEKEQNAFNTWLRQWYKVNTSKNSDGKTISTTLSYKGRTLDSFFQWLLSIERINTLWGNIPLAISNWIEHGIASTISTKFANRMYSSQVNNNPNYRYSEIIKSATMSKEGKEAYRLLSTMYDIGGWGLLDLYAKQKNADFTRESVLSFVNKIKEGSLTEFMRLDEAQKKNLTDTASKLLYKINTTIQDIATGSLAMSGIDANNFMQNLMINLSISNSLGDPTVTTKTIEDSIQANGIANTMLALMARKEGKDAYISSVNLSAGKVSPWTYMVNQLLKRNGVTSFFLSNFTSIFLRYNVAFMELMIPFSNCINYFAVHNMTKGKLESSLRDNTLGGQFLNGEDIKDNDAFWQGAKKCLKYDLARMSTFGAVALLMTAISLMLGVDEPEDETLRYNPLSWIRDEQFIPAWWLNDIVGWGLPLGVSLAIFMKTGDPILFYKNFVNGIASMMDSNVIFETITFLTRGPEQITNGLDAIENGDSNAAPDPQSYFTNMALDKGAEMLYRFTPLSGATSWIYRGDSFFIGNEMLDHASNQVYNTENYTMEEAKEKNKTYYVDYNETKARERSKKYWTSAAINNAFRNHTLPWEGETDKETGYFIWQQPIKKYSNPKLANFFELNDFDPEDPGLALAEDGGASIREQKAEDDLAILLSYKSPEEFVAQGGFLTYDTRKFIQQYIYEQKSNLLIAASEANQDVEQMKTEVYNSDEYQQLMSQYSWTGSELWNELQAYKNKSEDLWTDYNKLDAYYDYIINYWLWNDSIPFSEETYEVYKSDYWSVYTWSDSGEPATIIDYWVFPDKVEKDLYRIGNRSSSLLPFTSMVKEEEKTYNNETPLNFYDENITDTNRLFKEGEEVTVERGYYTGKNLNSVLFGGSSDLPNAENVDYAITPHAPGETVDNYGTPTIGMRGLKSNSDRESSRGLREFSFADYCEENGIDLDKLMGDGESSNTTSSTNKNSNGSSSGKFVSYRGFSKSSGGSSYSPKIYSRGSNAYLNGKAYLMQSSRPYNVSLGYLKPMHYTQGSRDAYKRSE